MALTDKHPSYLTHVVDWETMRDTYAGERRVKQMKQTYLPATSAQVADKVDVTDSIGFKSYEAYLKRSVFPTNVEDTVTNFLGMLHSKPAEIKLPPGMEKLREKATINGESLEQLLMRINEEQLIAGRCGLLVDLPEEPSVEVRPYIVLYKTERVVNWDEGAVDDPTVSKLNLVVLDETEFEREETGFNWVRVEKQRVLQLGKLGPNEAKGEYRQALFSAKGDNGATYREDALVAPVIRGKPFGEIPFVFCNATDILAEPLRPPLLGVANLACAIYRGEADYRQALYMQAQNTLVIIGGGDGDEVRVGATACINVSVGGDAKYISAGHEGLSEQRASLENDKRAAAVKGGQMLDNSSKEKESGDALRIRVGARATTLIRVARTGAGALQELLRMIARWMGEDEKLVVVKANEEFVIEALAGQDLAQIMTAKQLGAPISSQSIHGLMRRRSMTHMTYEEEQAAIDGEPPPITGVANQNGAGPNNLAGGGPGNTGA